jgi:hypothetical protein
MNQSTSVYVYFVLEERFPNRIRLFGTLETEFGLFLVWSVGPIEILKLPCIFFVFGGMVFMHESDCLQ